MSLGFVEKKHLNAKNEGILVDDDVFAPIGVLVAGEVLAEDFLVFGFFSEEMSGNKVPEGHEL